MLKNALFFEKKMEKSLQHWGRTPSLHQTPKLLLPSLVPVTLKLRPIISYLSHG